MNYFAYGSNMDSARLEARVGRVRALGVGRLGGYQLRFHKRGRDGSGKCDAYATGPVESAMYGVVFALDDRQAARLDEFEGSGYEVRGLTVQTDRGGCDAFLYVARPSSIAPDLRPFDWYKGYVLRGAVEHGLPDWYRHLLRGVSTIDDTDRGRAMRNDPGPPGYGQENSRCVGRL